MANPREEIEAETGHDGLRRMMHGTVTRLRSTDGKPAGPEHNLWMDNTLVSNKSQ